MVMRLFAALCSFELVFFFITQEENDNKPPGQLAKIRQFSTPQILYCFYCSKSLPLILAAGWKHTAYKCVCSYGNKTRWSDSDFTYLIEYTVWYTSYRF